LWRSGSSVLELGWLFYIVLYYDFCVCGFSLVGYTTGNYLW